MQVQRLTTKTQKKNTSKDKSKSEQIILTRKGARHGKAHSPCVLCWNTIPIPLCRKPANHFCSPSVKYSVSICPHPMPAAMLSNQFRNLRHQQSNRILSLCASGTIRVPAVAGKRVDVASIDPWTRARKSSTINSSSADWQNRRELVVCLVWRPTQESVADNFLRARPHCSVAAPTAKHFCMFALVWWSPNWHPVFRTTQSCTAQWQRQMLEELSATIWETWRQRISMRPTNSATCCNTVWGKRVQVQFQTRRIEINSERNYLERWTPSNWFR